jgi:Domain of unknown function (DUF4157)
MQGRMTRLQDPSRPAAGRALKDARDARRELLRAALLRPSDPRLEREADEAARSDSPGVARLSPISAASADPAGVAAFTPRSAGAALAPAIERSMKMRFKHDFSQVRVHATGEASELAVALQARAYAAGPHVVFGRAQYAPDQPAGRALLTHELAHVVQQERAGLQAVQRQDLGQPAQATVGAPADPELALGTRLVKDFPAGVPVAFYAAMPFDNEAAQGAAERWAARESAIGLKGKAITAANVVVGAPIAEASHPLQPTLTQLAGVLSRSVAKAPAPAAGPPAPGTGPATVRTLAVFAHGTSDWCGLGRINSGTAAAVVKGIAPTLAPTVNVVLYSCNAGRDPDASEDWVKGTMQGGGSSSLAGKVRDALVGEGKTGGTVWGHTTTGHVSENFALREFSAASGVGSEGISFVATYVWSGADRAVITQDLLDGVIAQGYSLTSPKAAASAEAVVTSQMYRCYATANKELRFNGGKLAESAPTHPVEVGKQIKDYWTATYWPAHRDKAIDALRKDLLATKRAKKD